jgi:hypothetical protein
MEAQSEGAGGETANASAPRTRSHPSAVTLGSEWLMDYFITRRTRKELPGLWFRKNELAGRRIPSFQLNI